MKPRTTRIVCALSGALVVVSTVSAQEKAASAGEGPLNLGDSQADLVYTPVAPCRIIDTRLAGGPIAGGTTRNFRVTGTDLSAQGGSATGCGIPSGPATAAVINFVAVNPAGPGDLRITPFGTPMPTASILNYAAVPGLNIANGPAVTICDPAVAACSSDFTIQADVGATQVVADVQGYFRNLRADQLPVPNNPNQVAILRWYSANQTANFPVGIAPFGVAFDGANIWVTNEGSNNVTKLRASDGTNLGTFPVGANPIGVAFDGANIWVANYLSNNVATLRASDGTNLGTFPVGSLPFGVAFDGANIWVANRGSNNVTKLLASDGTTLGTFPVGTNPEGVAFDGANIWVANFNSGNVTKLRASDGTNLGSFPVGTDPVGVAFDGANIWVANHGSNTVTKLRASDGTNLGAFPVGAAPRGVAFDGANIWVANGNSNTVSKR
jgi:outer membrane lipoprotein-sorting protein